MRTGGLGRIGWIAATLVGACLCAPPAHAFVYWVDGSNDGATIGRASNDGTAVDRDFITGLDDACGIEVAGGFLYWANRGTNSIGRANIDGTGVNETFIVNDPDTALPCDPAVGGGRIWWVNAFAAPPMNEGAIGRANLDGSGVDSTVYVSPTATSSPFSVAVTSQFVFWANAAFNMSPGPSIGRAGVDGTPPPDIDFIPLGPPVVPAWMTSSDDRIYVSATLFLSTGAAVFSFDDQGSDEVVIQDADASGGVAVLGERLFWANNAEGTFSTAALDGSSPDYAIARGLGRPRGIAVDGGTPPRNDFAFGKLRRNKRKGTAKLPVEVPAPGSLSLEARGLKSVAKDATAPGVVKLALAAAGNLKRKLQRKGRVTALVTVTFTPSGSGGVASTQSMKVKLIRK